MSHLTIPKYELFEVYFENLGAQNIFISLKKKKDVFIYVSTLLLSADTPEEGGHQIPLQMVVIHLVVAGSQTQDLWESIETISNFGGTRN